MNHLFVTLDMQFGSTGKGLFTHMLATKVEPDTCVHAFGPNAGHTIVLEDGNRYVHTMVGSSFIVPSCKVMLIGPGAILDPISLGRELAHAAHFLQSKTVIIHPQAAVIDERHRQEEEVNVAIGSTMKGTGAALIEKIRRLGTFITAEQCEKAVMATLRSLVPYEAHMHFYINEGAYNDAIDDSRILMCEGAQGHSLSIHSQFYPYTTSRDVSIHQLFSDCRLPRPRYRSNVYVYGVARTYPIRVANRFNKEGGQVGTSGGCYPDQEEVKWEDLGQKVELTTVTKLPRRIFTFSLKQIKDAVRLNRPQAIFLNFANYLDESTPSEHKLMNNKLRTLIGGIEGATGVHVQYVGFGPKASDVWENHDGILRRVMRGSMPDTTRIGE